MGEVSTIGLDIAKSVFQVHGVDADGAVEPSATASTPMPAARVDLHYWRCGRPSKVGTPSVMRWKGWPSAVKIAICAPP